MTRAPFLVARLASGGAFHVVIDGRTLCGCVTHPAGAWVRSTGAPSCSRCCVAIVRLAMPKVAPTRPAPPAPIMPRLARRVVAVKVA